ncbi:MAG: DUF952 domain-containing protein [Microthrixaceae bacterium]
MTAAEEPTGVLVHLVPAADWAAGGGGHREYRPPGTGPSDFLHLSSPEQVLVPAGRLFAGREDLLVVVLDPARLDGELRWELGDPPEGDLRFPHLYPVDGRPAAIPPAAVLAARPLELGADGRHLPPDVTPAP